MEIDDAMAVGQRIRELRHALGYESATAFARHVGTTPQALSNWESGYRRIGIEEAKKLARVTGATLDWLYFGREDYLPTILSLKLDVYRKGLRPKAEAPFRLSA